MFAEKNLSKQRERRAKMVYLNADNNIDRLLSGLPLTEREKPKKDADLYKPTPFVIHKETYEVSYLRQTCQRCAGVSVSFDSFYNVEIGADGSKKYHPRLFRDVPAMERERAEIRLVESSIPFCFACANSRKD